MEFPPSGWYNGEYTYEEWAEKAGFSELSQGIEQQCHSEPVRLSGVGISIIYLTIHRHPFVGAGLDPPAKRANFGIK